MSSQGGKSVERGGNTSVESNGRMETADRDDPTEQEVFDVLSNRRRRYALYALLNDGETTIGSLADRIAAWENDCAVADVTPAERKRVYTALQQSHVPKLERLGLVDFDADSGRISPTDVTADVDAYLDVVDEPRQSWTRFCVGVSALSVGLAAAVWLNLPLVGAVDPRLWLTLVAGLVTTATVTRTYRSSNRDLESEPPDVNRP